MSADWAWDAVFYHVYPLGLCGAPDRNDGNQTEYRLKMLYPWIDHIAGMGFNALYLGPLFESESHGYDTIDYSMVDRRLGDVQTLRDLVAAFHGRGIRVILDAVFNHVGRAHPAFRSLREMGAASPYASWFKGLDFSRPNSEGDAFSYEGWNGHQSLVKLDGDKPEVRKYLVDAALSWIRDYDIDGLRLDAADVLSMGFMEHLAAACRAEKQDFWLVGEVVHGDYRAWARPGALDSVTNYEAYKGLWSSLNDRNCYEISWTLGRQFAREGGLYSDLDLYSFVDNHDVARAASILKSKTSLYPLYGLMFTMPGVPSVYYGSEWGIEGIRLPHSDAPLRPALDLDAMRRNPPERDLPVAIHRFIGMRRDLPPLRYGAYHEIFTSHLQFAFARTLSQQESVLVVLNADGDAARLKLNVSKLGVLDGDFEDYLEPGSRAQARGGILETEVPPNWLRVLRRL